ncbi:MAG TPA: NBR1-Ig-like domain-containing protein, partial [Bacteroidales bacterium]|nr:NBR1-Ig-like domain-containing protein [Bacteroidales bacterium]
FNITAPDEIGKYSFQWQIVKQDEDEGAIWIGEKSDNVVITVGSIDGTSYTEIYEGIISRRAEINDDENAEKAFDNLYTSGEKNADWSKWLDDGGVPHESDPSWIQIEFPDAVTVNMFALVSGNDAPERDPENFRLKGSNDGQNWDILESIEGQIFNSRFEEKLYPFDNTSAYRFYRFETTKNKGDDSMTQLCEIRLIQLGAYAQLAGKATNPNPEQGSHEVLTETNLSWTSGLNATSHDVYFGVTNPPEFAENQTDTVFDPGTLLKSTTYFWRINEINDDGTKVGNVWSFRTEAGYSDAAFVSQNLPKTTLVKGESMEVSLVMRNTGEQTWSSSGRFMLASQNTPFNFTWGLNTIALDEGELIEPGEEKTYDFTITAPNTPGKYALQWQMRNLDGWFGEPSENKLIKVNHPVRVDHISENDKIVVLNPATKGRLIIKTRDINQPVLVDIFNLKGQKVHHLEIINSITNVDVSDLHKGVYLIKAQYENGFDKELIIIE